MKTYAPSPWHALKALCFAALPFLYSCGGGNDAPLDIAASLKSAGGSAPACGDGRLGDLKQVYSASTFLVAQNNFRDRFRVKHNGDTLSFDNIDLRIPLSALKAAEDSVAKPGKPVRGIYVSYGVSGTVFKPVIEFMYADSALRGDLRRFKSRRYVLNTTTGKLDTVSVAQQEVLQRNYLDSVLVDRLGNGVFTPLRPDTAGQPEPDAQALWMPYADRLNMLFRDNLHLEPTHLVISCISERFCHGNMLALPATEEEYQHLLSFHLANGKNGDTDLLNTRTNPADSALQQRALDLGQMRPPYSR